MACAQSNPNAVAGVAYRRWVVLLLLLAVGITIGIGHPVRLAAAETVEPPFDPAAAAAKLSAQELIESLIDEDPDFQQAVRAELIRRGKVVVPDLRRNLYHHDPDVRKWVKHIYRQIGAGSAWNAEIRKALAETRVTLVVEGQFFPIALDRLRDASGLELSLSPHLKTALETLNDEQQQKLMVSFLAANEPVGKILDRMLADTGLDASLVFDGVVVEAGEAMRHAVVEQALKTRIKPVSLNKVPVDKLLAHLRKKSPVDIVMDPQAVAQMTGKDWTVTLETEREISLKSALAQTLNGWDLVIAFDETRLIVTTKDANIANTRQVSLDIHELIDLMRDNAGDEDIDEMNLAAEVIVAIKSCVQRRTWEKPGVQIASVRLEDGLALQLVQWEGTISAIKDFVGVLRLGEERKKELREAAARPKKQPLPGGLPTP